MLFEGSVCLRRVPFLLIAVLLLAGCATMGKDECLNANWLTIGFEDGSRGYPGNRIGEHRKACAKHGVTPDLAAYESGRKRGLVTWCAPRNGYRIGLGGGQYNGVCPRSMEAPFIEAVSKGRAVYGYQKEVNKARNELKQMHKDLEGMDEDLVSMEAEMISNGVTPRRRVQLLREIRQLEDDKKLFINDIGDMEIQVADMQANLDRMKAENHYP